jgi:hypothetical protein
MTTLTPYIFVKTCAHHIEGQAIFRPCNISADMTCGRRTEGYSQKLPIRFDIFGFKTKIVSVFTKLWTDISIIPCTNYACKHPCMCVGAWFLKSQVSFKYGKCVPSRFVVVYPHVPLAFTE